MSTEVLNKRNMKTFLLISSLSILIFMSCQKSYSPAKDIELLPLFTDNMVLQQKQAIPIWGTAEPGGEVTVTLNDQQSKGIVDSEGNWKVSLSPVPAGGPYELSVRGEKTIKINNVMIGEVWICSGQSNMEMAVNTEWGKINNAAEEVANANYPNIRLLMVNKVMSTTPQEKFASVGWKECSPKTISNFSAVAYLFGRKLHKDLNISIGLIETAWGGTVVEAWTSAKTLKSVNEYEYQIESLDLGLFERKTYKRSDNKEQKAWVNEVQDKLQKSGVLSRGYNKFGYNSKSWKSLDVPKVWESQNINFDGVMWVKKEITIPQTWEGKDLVLSLESINDFDITWFNGEKVGSMPNASMPRSYTIPKELVKIGKNEITVLILDIGNNGGIYGNPNNTVLGYSKETTISLAGKWKYKKDKFDLNLISHPPGWDISVAQNRPTVLYNGMINPLLPYGMRGVIWYQGEGNADRAMQYRKLFKALINDWRDAWGQGDFPFLFVQLANFMKRHNTPTDETWAHLREAQTMALELHNTGMAVTIDIGDAKDIHPKNKQDVGKRLALNALAKVYGKDIAYSGPMYKSMKNEGSMMRLKFTNTDKGLKIKGSKQLNGFAIAGKDKKFVWAKAKIEGNEVVVWNSNVKNPIAVRYAWANNPICNLYNGAELPASPFRTDDW